MNWATSNLSGNNRLSRAFLLRYSTVPLAIDVTESSSNSSNNSILTAVSDKNYDISTSSNTVETVHNVASSFAQSFLHVTRHVPGRAVQRNTSTTSQTQLSLPIDVEKTVTCFCRKARRKERDGDQNATDTKLYLEESVLERKLPEADLKALVDLPAGLDYNEWLASHTLALFEHVNLVYGTISEFCTPSGCPDMMGPGNRTYLWFDEKGKKTRVAAPQYIDYVMTFTQKTVSDESIFPTKYANEFPSSFESIARKILRLQFHVIAHLYAVHFREIALLGLHTHLNLTFAHLTALHRRFNLIDEKETDVLRDLELALRLTDDNSSTTTFNNNANNTNFNSNNNFTNNNIINNNNINNNNNNNSSSSNSNTNNCNGSVSNINNQGNNTNNINKYNSNNYNYNYTYNNNNNNNQLQQQQPNQINLNNLLTNITTTNAIATTTTTTTTNDEHHIYVASEDGDNIIMGAVGSNTITTSVIAINDGSNLYGDNVIDGDASVPPICAQPEITANKCELVNMAGEHNNTDLYDKHGGDQQQQQQPQQQQKITTLDHVHTRLIQCNASTAPSNMTISAQNTAQYSNNISNNNNISSNSNNNASSSYVTDAKRSSTKY